MAKLKDVKFLDNPMAAMRFNRKGRSNTRTRKAT